MTNPLKQSLKNFSLLILGTLAFSSSNLEVFAGKEAATQESQAGDAAALGAAFTNAAAVTVTTSEGFGA